MLGQAVREVTILMGVYNGAPHLPAQLESIAAQRGCRWRLVCSDDGSTDDSRAVLTRFGASVEQNVDVIDGPRAGFSANFMAMIAALPEESGPVAFADQDDVWLESKLARALTELDKVPEETPALYCARRYIWDPLQDTRQATPAYTRAPSFRNALIENIAPGNTIVLNKAGARLASMAARRTDAVFAHDWWLYLLISGVGGRVIFDAGAPCLLYRQHAGNEIGGGTGMAEQLSRKMAVLQGAFRDRLSGNIAALQAVRDVLTPENAAHLDTFAGARSARLPGRVAGLWRAAPYRQSVIGNLGFWGAALLGRV